MEALTRLVTDSLARHGFDRPIDPRRLQWSNWFRCDSPHSLLVVPSKPGIFAIAEEIIDFAKPHVGTAALGCPAEPSSSTDREGHDFSRAEGVSLGTAALAAEGLPAKRMLAVIQFSEDDDMAFTLDRMFTRINPMRARLSSGRCFLRFVVIEDQTQRRSICSALNQWMLTSAEKATGIPAAFSSSLEISMSVAAESAARGGRTSTAAPANTVIGPGTIRASQPGIDPNSLPSLDSGADKNLHHPHPLPSGF